MHLLQSNIIKTKHAHLLSLFFLSNSLRQLNIKQNIKITLLIFVYKKVMVLGAITLRAKLNKQLQAPLSFVQAKP